MEPTQTKPRLHWRRQPNERGLARVCQGERGYDLMYGTDRIGSARPVGRGLRTQDGYFYYVRVGSLFENTASTPVPTMEEAKTACMALVKACLKNPTP